MIATTDVIQQEATEMLRKLIRINTTNPQGNELEAVRFIASVAEQDGIPYEIMETAPGRGNILLKLQGRKSGPPLIMLSHLDVVGANAEEWKYPPFEGMIADGYLWGRGTVDTKQLTAMELMTMLLLARRHVVPERDVYMIATADEESGSVYGLKALLETHGELFRDADVISEGGGFPILVNGKVFYLCEVGQKGLSQVKFTYKRTPNANPFYPENTGIRTFGELIRRIANNKWEGDIPATTVKLLDQLMQTCGEETDFPVPEQAEYLKSKISPLFANMIKAMTESTIALTMWHGGRKRRDLVGEYEAMADVRLLPGVSREDVERKLAELCEGLPIDWEILSYQPGYDSGCEGALFDRFCSVIPQMIEGAAVVPFIATGSSDGRYLKEYNSRVYGFSPVLAEDMTFEQAVTMVHGINERISCDSIGFGATTLFQAVLQYCTGGENRD
jgi:acetylornithine deacetylase/succinyl-diaminopimelate desuccinylase-like protein